MSKGGDRADIAVEGQSDPGVADGLLDDRTVRQARTVSITDTGLRIPRIQAHPPYVLDRT